MQIKTQKLRKVRKLSKSSQKWILRQLNDPFVEKAKKEGWKSRAAFKIIEIDEKFKIFKKGHFVVDLGCAPGGWSQFAVKKVGENNVLGIDLLEISPINGVKFIQQDFLAEGASDKIIDEIISLKRARSKGKDLTQTNFLTNIVLSDMAANTIGDKRTDHTRIIALLEESLVLAEKILAHDGCFVGKIFQGGSSDEIVKKLRQNFKSVKYFKPESSRKDSAETYLVATGFERKPMQN